MNRRVRGSLVIAVAFAALCLCSGRLQASAQDTVIHPWEDLGRGFIASYGWPSVLYHASAVAVTPPLVYGLDLRVQTYFQRHNPLGQSFADVTLVVGWVAPVLVPLGLYIGGLTGGGSELATVGAAALQTALVQTVIVNVLKWLTDRAGAYPNGDPSQARNGIFRDTNNPKDFNFNPFDLKGRLWWPSGHTAGNISIISALVAFYPDQPWIAIIGYPLALAIGLGMIEGDYHWLSDVVAGGLIGHAIGWVIGKHFRARYDAARSGKPQTSTFELQPTASAYGAGLSVVYSPAP